MSKMAENGKAFYNVIQMSEKFREFEKEILAVMAGGLPENATAQEIDLSMRVWQLRAEFAQAQQLCNISEQLKKLNEVLLSNAGTKVSE